MLPKVLTLEPHPAFSAQPALGEASGRVAVPVRLGVLARLLGHHEVRIQPGRSRLDEPLPVTDAEADCLDHDAVEVDPKVSQAQDESSPARQPCRRSDEHVQMSGQALSEGRQVLQDAHCSSQLQYSALPVLATSVHRSLQCGPSNGLLDSRLQPLSLKQ